MKITVRRGGWFRRRPPSYAAVLCVTGAGGLVLLTFLLLQEASRFAVDKDELGNGEINSSSRLPSKQKLSEGLAREKKQISHAEEYSENDIIGLDEETDYYYEYDEENNNPVFRDGDFDPLPLNQQAPVKENVNKESLSNNYYNDDIDNNIGIDYNGGTAERKLQSRPNSSFPGLPKGPGFKSVSQYSTSITKKMIIEDKIFWSKGLESITPKGLSDSDIAIYLSRFRSAQVTDMQSSTWNRCGRPKNQHITFGDGTEACARYRTPYDYLVQGEILSFYLSRLLSIHNVPIVILSSLDDEQWDNTLVRNQMKEARWQRNATVALIQWIENLERSKMPFLLLKSLYNKSCISYLTEELLSLSLSDLIELLQWSDLIIFDFITGNYDRVASMQDAADKDEKSSVLNETVHNLAKSRKTKGLWFIDNESGILDAYSLLYTGSKPQRDRFSTFHREVLSSMCIFRKSTYDRIMFLRSHSDSYGLLIDTILSNEPNFRRFPDISNYREVQTHFRERIEEVYNHMHDCLNKVIQGGTS